MFENFKSIYFIGIGGISMSALARIFKARGYEVFGIDTHETELIKQLIKEGMQIEIGEKSSNFVEICDAVVYTCAVEENNKDLFLARKFNKPIFSRAEILGELSKEFKTISIAGTHGKTTTTGMIANCLIEAGRDPTIHIGGILNNISSNLRIGKGTYLVTEACEYKDSFLTLKNFISVVLNVEEDHLDYFKNLDNIFNSFNDFIGNTSTDGIVIYNYDAKYKKLKLPSNAISFGFDKGADIQARDIKERKGKYSFNLYYLNKKIGRINLPCYGKHNILNSLACCAVCIFLGFSFKELKLGIETFRGIERRFQILSEENALIFHDYAHHPKEIATCLQSCRDINNRGKLITIFQPHTFTRTRDLYEEFIKCFDLSDEVWFLPIYPARETPIENITSQNLCKDISKYGKSCRYFDNFKSCIEEIEKENKKNTIIAILGAGDIINLANKIKHK